mmetsp:Transcript_49382/g.105077  ORF Transcript_49382/g.105077 Transcript_49382/m.105077 type:complete len:481 (-) Transcript_49382:33-1475(-)|eukprot:CAMPEP_0206481172 /NCGR_PEP_ID=MMETSP0324_2-20121206/37961_1 /ASSEMBLY_ACC=CAM_ASM_000836 /TAXON_ID=2866 /ORGANISM="Crypthecodinium cohnii, Strain Seligo" /LENGTH=480 /DNA_ID=CAMNT_0053958559 /DNA_START=172 /DNA_END=1614 /DNA_ORIENTATION=+
MINYNNRNLCFIFFNRAGSVLFSRYVLFPAGLSTVFCGLVVWHPEGRRFAAVSKTIAQIYATIIGFALVFRTTLAFGRYFEGVRNVQAMFSKWRDAYVAQAVFIETSILTHEQNRRLGLSKGIESTILDLHVSKARLLHWFSLLCAVAVGSIQHGRDAECDVAADLGNARISGLQEFSTFEAEVHEVLDESKACHTERKEDRNHIQVLGQITPDELALVSQSQEAVNLVMMWILLEITRLAITKKVLIEPPILSRVYQELSNGMLSYFRAMQIECVPFPFPFAQVMNFALYVMYFFVPFIAMTTIEALPLSDPIGLGQMWSALLLNFVAVAGYAACNEVAIELEDPFGEDDNDYPVAVQQWAVTWAIEDSYFAPVPEPFAGREDTPNRNISPTSVAPGTSMLGDGGSRTSGSRGNIADQRSAPVDRGPMASQFRRLHDAIELFAGDVGRHGSARQAESAVLQKHRAALEAAAFGAVAVAQ